jgi:hypothetical protein
MRQQRCVEILGPEAPYTTLRSTQGVALDFALPHPKEKRPDPYLQIVGRFLRGKPAECGRKIVFWSSDLGLGAAHDNQWR